MCGFRPAELRRIVSRMVAIGDPTLAASGLIPRRERRSGICGLPLSTQAERECSRWFRVYNGEVYSAPELRAELQSAGRQFRRQSDAEVVVEGIAVWGVRPTIERLIGMFAFAVWDCSIRTLTLARDRLGIKLYWGHANGSLVFALGIDGV